MIRLCLSEFHRRDAIVHDDRCLDQQVLRSPNSVSVGKATAFSCLETSNVLEITHERLDQLKNTLKSAVMATSKAWAVVAGVGPGT